MRRRTSLTARGLGTAAGQKQPSLKCSGNLGFENVPDITGKAIQSWFDNQRKCVPASAHGYMLTVRAFPQLGPEAKVHSREPRGWGEDGQANQIRTGKILHLCAAEHGPSRGGQR